MGLVVCLRRKHVIWIAVASLLLAGCLSTTDLGSLQQCITNFEPNVDYYSKFIPPDVTNQSFVLPIPLDLLEVDTATGFAVKYGNYYKIIENQFFNLTYILYQCGAPRPSPLLVGLPTTTKANTFQLPVSNVSTDSTIPLAFLEILGQLRKVSLTSSADYISSPCVLKYMADGEMAQISDSAPNSAEVDFTSAQGIPTNATNAVSFDATYDGGPLKRAEWIKYLATFLNVEESAEIMFSDISRTYQCLNGSMGSSGNKPTVAWLQYYDGVWSLSNASFKVQFNSDAGGANLDATTLSTSFNMSIGSDLASFHQVLKQLDVVVDETYAVNPFQYSIQNFTDNAQLSASDQTVAILTKKRVWRVDKRVGLNYGLDWYEGAIPQPHVVLYDLIGILYPSQNWNQTYFRNIGVNEPAVNVSALPCEYSISDVPGPTVILDPQVVKCVSMTGSSPRSYAFSLLTPALVLVVMATLLGLL